MCRFSLRRQLVVLVSLASVLATPAMAAEVPAFAEVTGHEFGRRITQHHEMAAYLRALAEASPRVAVIDQGVSWEGRALLLAVVTSPENHARLGTIRQNARLLGDPRVTTPEGAAAIVEDQPAILFMGGSIHGFELSGSEGVLKLLEHLATRDDEETLRALESTVVLIDPMLNPDGRDAFAQRNHRDLGREPSAQRDDWSNDFTRWDALSFRTGHYFFDTNRDWWAQTQRETRARVPTLREWRPQVVVDLHEMGPDTEFYFDPAAEPYGPYFPEFARKWFDRFGRAYAAAFDAAGFEYMTRERYNYFYPGYTTSFGSYQGAVGMLYEQGSSRGLALTRADESVRRLEDALQQQYTAAWTAVRTAVANRTELLRDYYDAHERDVADGRTGIRRFLLPPSGDPSLRLELAALLQRVGIEIDVLDDEIRLEGVRDREGEGIGARSFPVGTYVVEAAQPRNRLLRALLEPDLPIEPEFLDEARERLDRGENPRFYDITAWSLPLLFDLDVFSTSDGRAVSAVRLAEPGTVGGVPADDPGYAYTIDGRQAASLAGLYHLKSGGYRAAVSLEPTRIGETEIAAGSVVVRIGQNEAAIHAAVRQVAKRYDLNVTGVDTGLSLDGYPALGSVEVLPVKTPRVGLVAGEPVHGYSFGWACYTLDRQYEIPVTVRRVESLVSAPLDRLDVLVIPNLLSADALADAVGAEGLDRLRRWTRDGGSLVALADGVDFVLEKLELGSLRSWYAENAEGEGDEKQEPRAFRVPGAILRAEFDRAYWLSAGLPRELPVLVDSSRIYLAPEGPPSSQKRVVARYGAEKLRISGTVWPESLERLPGAVFAYEERVGRGRVILFAEDLNYRAYWRGANRLFLNAVLLSPSAP